MLIYLDSKSFIIVVNFLSFLVDRAGHVFEILLFKTVFAIQVYFIFCISAEHIGKCYGNTTESVTYF